MPAFRPKYNEVFGSTDEERGMRFLLTNDDGIDAQGLAALREAAQRFGPTAVIAPDCNHSVCGHRVTTDRPLRAKNLGDHRWSTDGTPADCVRIGLSYLTPKVEWVLAGMNHGGNLGTDVHHSGTVAAVREAALHGRPGIAFSHYRKRGMEIDWPRATAWMERALAELLNRPPQPGEYWNVNLPHLRTDEPEPQLRFCPLDNSPLPLEFRQEGDLYVYAGNYHGRARVAGGDVETCFAGDISISLLRL